MTESEEKEIDDSKEDDKKSIKREKGKNVGKPNRSTKLPKKENKPVGTTTIAKATETTNTPKFPDGKNETVETLATLNLPDEKNKTRGTPPIITMTDKKTNSAGTPITSTSQDRENTTLDISDSLAETNKDMDTAVVVGVLTSLAVLAVVVTALVCIRHYRRMKEKQRKHAKRKDLNNETETPHVYSEIDEIAPTTVPNQASRTDAEDLVVTYNAMYNMESSPDKSEEVAMNHHTYHILTPNTTSDEGPDIRDTNTADSELMTPDGENYTEIDSLDNVSDTNLSKSEENASCLNIYHEINEVDMACLKKTQ